LLSLRSFPTRRSSDLPLDPSRDAWLQLLAFGRRPGDLRRGERPVSLLVDLIDPGEAGFHVLGRRLEELEDGSELNVHLSDHASKDRKSTRLNSSHQII